MKKPMFTLSRRNQKGQVAIFVALIFQVIFVFFALLVNIGLLVHHKINLQQSTDLAAYYGAMKQAESLNAMAHVNFQIRQAWKLLAWRYRVLGTFGNQKATFDGDFPTLPVSLNNSISEVNSLQVFKAGRCPAVPPNAIGASTAETPFFCIGHSGMKDWPVGENLCKVNCKLLNNQLLTVKGVSNPLPVTSQGNAQDLHTALSNINANLGSLCKDLAGANAKVLAQFILSYQQELKVRSQTIQMLAGNLSNSAEYILDLDGNKIVDGLKRTLKNNLTEANSNGDLKINSYNSLSDSKCSINTNQPAGKRNGKAEFIKRIEFDFIDFFQHSCRDTRLFLTPGDDEPNLDYNPGSIFNLSHSGFSSGETITLPGGQQFVTMKINPPVLKQSVEDEIKKLILNDGEKFSIGYEKNPWCPAYYVVQATASPRIPFLPLSDIKLSAVAVAKPFGGSIGPWFGKSWDSGALNSQDGLSINSENKQVDELLPSNNTIGAPPATLKESSRLLMNFSRFVGDQKGLSDPVYLAEYHGALITRKSASTADLFGSTRTNEPGPPKLSPPTENPSLNSWTNIIDFVPSAYDPLIGGQFGRNSFLRDLEISAIAPNQFDVTYYSIDPDFYNNYYKRLSDPAIFQKLQTSSGNIGPSVANFVRPDFGNNKTIYPKKEDFGVRNQIEIVKRVFADSGFNTGLDKASPRFIDVFPELVKKQSSLLTGWTFSNFTSFDKFPGGDMTLPSDTMNFARCNDKWQDDGGGQPKYETPMDINPNYPPTPGNCVTGGRVGYSVKLISPRALSSDSQSLGGVGVAPGSILNPIPAIYLKNFP